MACPATDRGLRVATGVEQSGLVVLSLSFVAHDHEDTFRLVSVSYSPYISDCRSATLGGKSLQPVN
jgi:hypothetical protein